MKPLMIVAPEFKADALTALVVNHLQNKVKVVAVKSPWGDDGAVDDLAALTGAKVVREYTRIGRIDPV